MTKLTSKEWGDIETLYKMGKKVREIADQYGYDAGNIVKKAKQYGWIHGELQQPIAEVANSVNAIQHKLQQIQQPNTTMINKAIISLSELKECAQDLQQDMLSLIKLATKQTRKIMENSPDGLYTRGESAQGAVQYGRTSEFVKDLLPAMVAANTILGLDKSTVEVNNNTQNNNDEQIVFNIQPVRMLDDSKS